MQRIGLRAEVAVTNLTCQDLPDLLVEKSRAMYIHRETKRSFSRQFFHLRSTRSTRATRVSRQFYA